jgi:O-antigen/teichoic acid export membrane protein
VSRIATNTIEPGTEPAAAAPRFAKAREWTKLIAITGSAQVAVQAIGFVCGILVIRLLPIEEYAYYTIANTMLGTMTLLADGGIASGVMSQGGKVWRDKQKLGAVLATGLRLRRQFAVWSLAVSIPILYFLLIKQGASWLTATMIAASLLPAFFSALSAKLLEISAKLHQDVTALQVIQVTSNTLRLALSGLMLFVFPFAALAIIASGASQIYGNWRLRGVSNKFADRAAGEDPEVRREILGIVKRVLPGAIYFSISLQLGTWILSFFGSNESIAQLGAISRITLVVGILTTIFGYLVAPRFARLPAVAALLRTHFLKVQLFLFVICLCGYLVAFCLTDTILLILPSEYHSLTYAFRLQLAIAAFGVIIGSLTALNASRGYVLHPQIHIPLNLTIVLATAAIFRPTSLVEVLYLDLTRAAIAPIIQNCIFFSHVRIAR